MTKTVKKVEEKTKFTISRTHSILDHFAEIVCKASDTLETVTSSVNGNTDLEAGPGTPYVVRDCNNPLNRGKMPTRFRPCIDLHEGTVKQIVGSTLSTRWKDSDVSDASCTTKVNFVSPHSSSYYARLFRKDGLDGGHIVMLGQCKANHDAAYEAIQAFPDGLHVGGGVQYDTALRWLKGGAAKVILSSYFFNESLQFDEERLRKVSELIGRKSLVVDLSCRPERNNARGYDEEISSAIQDNSPWIVYLNGWKTKSHSRLTPELISIVGEFASEILVHSIVHEGMCVGIDEQLVGFLGERPIRDGSTAVYAGGIDTVDCLQKIEWLSKGNVDATIGSALDLFGGSGIKYLDCVKWNKDRA